APVRSPAGRYGTAGRTGCDTRDTLRAGRPARTGRPPAAGRHGRSGMGRTALRCPRDASALTMRREYRIRVGRGPTGEGGWYDADEPPLLEATVTRDEEQRRGTIEFATRQSALSCPVCGVTMRAFNYRAYNLELDACPREHGFWLDAGEADRVREVMRER